jgi:hypothetical protein
MPNPVVTIESIRAAIIRQEGKPVNPTSIGIPTPLPAPLPGGGPKGYQPASQSTANHPVTQPDAKNT